MGKQVDLELINARSRKREQLVQDGRYFETIESEGRTPESIKAAARKVLGLPEDGLILLEATEIMKKQNVKTQAFVVFLNSASKIKGTGILSENELSVVESIEIKLAKSLCETYNISIDELYTEGE